MEKLLTLEQRKIWLKISEELGKDSEEILLWAIAMRKTFEKKGVEYDVAVFNAFEFVELLQCDLCWLLNDMVKHDSAWRGGFYARLIVLTVYESCKSLNSLLARKFREEFVKSLGLTEDSSLKSIHSSFCKLFEQCRKDFGDVRNGIVGHRDCDPETRIRLLKQANCRAVADLAIAMLEPLRELQEIFLPYIRHITNKLGPAESSPK